MTRHRRIPKRAQAGHTTPNNSPTSPPTFSSPEIANPQDPDGITATAKLTLEVITMELKSQRTLILGHLDSIDVTLRTMLVRVGVVEAKQTSSSMTLLMAD